MDRDRLLLRGILLTVIPFGAVVLLRAGVVPDHIARMHATAWAMVGFFVLVAAMQAFGLVRLNRSRGGTWGNGKAVLAVLLSACGWLLMIVYAFAALGMFAYALSPGVRLFGGR